MINIYLNDPRGRLFACESELITLSELKNESKHTLNSLLF